LELDLPGLELTMLVALFVNSERSDPKDWHWYRRDRSASNECLHFFEVNICDQAEPKVFASYLAECAKGALIQLRGCEAHTISMGKVHGPRNRSLIKLLVADDEEGTADSLSISLIESNFLSLV
jgi:hypothetical protein